MRHSKYQPLIEDAAILDISISRSRRTKIRNVYVLATSDTITVSDDLRRVRDFSLSDNLSVSESFGEEKSLSLKDTLTVTDQLNISKTVNRSLQDTLNITDGFLVQTSRNSRSCSTSPDPSFSSRNSVRLTYPYAAPTTTLELRNPEFGDSLDLATNTKMLRTRSGQLDPVRGVNWPIFQIINVNFKALSETQRTAFESFVQQSCAAEVGFLDQYVRQWRGVILTETISIVQTGIQCMFNTSFAFRGSLV